MKLVHTTLLRYLVGALCMGAAGLAQANPVGGKVVAGAAAIDSNGNTLTVNQSSHRAIINWQGFSIGAGEHARFNLPGSLAAVLNRVTGGDPSAIHGLLSSNGRVFLINPRGVVIGPGGRVATAGFVASTRDVNSERFMAGESLGFAGDSGAAVRNLGTIDVAGGDALLIGARVENAGTVSAPQGTVALLSGDEVLYAAGAASRVAILSGVDASVASSGVDNSGLIQAARVELRAAGGNPWNLAVNHRGTIDASSVENVGGRVLITGPSVNIAGTSAIDASGARGGGEILIGGGYRGGNAEVPNAGTTVVEKGARIRADAITQGDGGKVIAWADGTTRYEGGISARGGALGGDGGFAEVSGKGVLDYRGTADLKAPQGKTGTLLLDPTDITIGLAAERDPIVPEITVPSGGTFNGDTSNTSWLAIETLDTALQSANVTVTTASAGNGAGDLTLDGSLAGQNAIVTPNLLTLQAQRDILVSGNLAVVGDGGLVLEAGRNIEILPGRNTTGQMLGGFGQLPYALAGGINGGLTLAAGLTDTNGRIEIGADSNLGVDPGATGEPRIRVFAPSATNVSLAGWLGAAGATVTTGKAYGATGTDSAGIYYSQSGSTSGGGSSLINVGSLVVGNIISSNESSANQGGQPPADDYGWVSSVFSGALGNGLSDPLDMDSTTIFGKFFVYARQNPGRFSPEFTRGLDFLLSQYPRPPASAYDVGNALAQLRESILSKPPHLRTREESQQLYEMNLIMAGIFELNSPRWNPGGARAQEVHLRQVIEHNNKVLSSLPAARPASMTGVLFGTGGGSVSSHVVWLPDGKGGHQEVTLKLDSSNPVSAHTVVSQIQAINSGATSLLDANLAKQAAIRQDVAFLLGSYLARNLYVF